MLKLALYAGTILSCLSCAFEPMIKAGKNQLVRQVGAPVSFSLTAADVVWIEAKSKTYCVQFSEEPKQLTVACDFRVRSSSQTGSWEKKEGAKCGANQSLEDTYWKVMLSCRIDNAAVCFDDQASEILMGETYTKPEVDAKSFETFDHQTKTTIKANTKCDNL